MGTFESKAFGPRSVWSWEWGFGDSGLRVGSLGFQVLPLRVRGFRVQGLMPKPANFQATRVYKP